MNDGDERLFHGQLQVWDIDPDWWPDGLWMPVCRACGRGPLDDGRVYCGWEFCKNDDVRERRRFQRAVQRRFNEKRETPR